MGDDILFTNMNSMNRAVPIFAICIQYTIFRSYSYTLFKASFNAGALCAGGVT